MTWMMRAGLMVVVLTAGGMADAVWQGRALASDWRTASHASAGIAPDPATFREPVIQIYAARAWSWRGVFGVHTWISTKRAGAAHYEVHEVIGWRAYHGLPVVRTSERPPDGRWFGAAPDLLLDLRGAKYEAVIDKIEAAVRRYPFPDRYRVWPGPNSNTFTAFVARQVKELEVDLPPTAIGKDYLPNGIFARTPSGTGYQFSLAGLFGVMVAVDEGLEINVLGLTFGIDPLDLAVKLPMIGRVGPDPS